MNLNLTYNPTAAFAFITATADSDVGPNFIDIYRSDTGDFVQQTGPGGTTCTLDECIPLEDPRVYIAFIASDGDTSSYPPKGILAISTTVTSTHLCVP